MIFEAWISIVNFLLALFTFGLVIRFWWQHRRASLSRGWWILIFALGLFAIAETADAGTLLRPELPTVRLGLSVRLFFMAVLLVALYRLFEDVVAAQQRTLSEAQKTIQLQADAVRRAQEIELLARIMEQLTGTLDLNTVLTELCRRARELIHADSVSVRLPAPTSGGFRFAIDFASALKSRPERLEPAIDDLSWQVVKAGRPAIIEDAEAHPLFGPASPAWLGALAAFPLRRREEVIGVMTAVFDRPHQIEPRDQALMAALADQAAVAVRNAQLRRLWRAFFTSRCAPPTWLPVSAATSSLSSCRLRAARLPRRWRRGFAAPQTIWRLTGRER